mmetsp:Transcript_18970/g.35112  ORF Transcript_18970/g.35112 Transcript_18970/m.35112 type:complete len:239 (-) Transcript_18970:76-792(-)
MDLWDMARALVTKSKRPKSSRRSKRRGSLIPEEGIEDDDDEGQGINATEFTQVAANVVRTTNRNWEAVGHQKVASMARYANLFPEYDLVFFGDNGQGDLMAAEVVAMRPGLGDRFKMCFIHKVQSNSHESLLSVFDTKERKKMWAKHRIVFFETYMGAAILAFEANLISLHGLHRVGLAVHDELLEMFIRYPHREWDKVLHSTKRDIRLANKILREEGQDHQIPVPILIPSLAHEAGL